MLSILVLLFCCNLILRCSVKFHQVAPLQYQVIALLQQFCSEKVPTSPQLDMVATDVGLTFMDVDPLSSDSELEDIVIRPPPEKGD